MAEQGETQIVDDGTGRRFGGPAVQIDWSGAMASPWFWMLVGAALTFTGLYCLKKYERGG